MFIKCVRDLGIATAFYSDADAILGHVQLADEPLNIVPFAATNRHLNIDHRAKAAAGFDCNLIQPGYEFWPKTPGVPIPRWG